MTWIRRPPRSGLEQLTTLWHIQGEPNARIQAWRGVCGESLGDPVDVKVPGDEPDLGDRCPVCQGAHARGEYDESMRRLEAALDTPPAELERMAEDLRPLTVTTSVTVTPRDEADASA